MDDQPRLFMAAENEDRLVKLWVKLATRYRDEPTVAAYDLLNEPLPANTGAAAKYKHRLEGLYQRITKAIRSVDPKHVITLEGADWANDWSVFTQRFDDNLLYQFHYYCWEHPEQLKGIGQYLAYRTKLQAPIWVGETGEKNNAIYWATTDYFEANNVGWAFWPWKKMDTRNTPYSITAPANWELIVAYSKRGPKPARNVAQKIFQELLHSIRLENCRYFPDVVNSLFRRVPVRIEAENYGHEGRDKSFSVKNRAYKASTYRTSEPVPVVLETGATNGPSSQSIELNAGEWTAYTVESLESRSYHGSVRLRTETSPASIRVSVNDKFQRLGVSEKHWVEGQLEAFPLNQGTNRIKLQVERGAVLVDWLEFSP